MIVIFIVMLGSRDVMKQLDRRASPSLGRAIALTAFVDRCLPPGSACAGRPTAA